MRLGLSDGPDIIVLAGREKSFGGLGLMDFASIFAQTEAADSTKYFVTDHAQGWYTGCFEEIAAKLNALSGKPKIIFGNSMGGYGALRFAQALRNTIGVMAFVPQMRVPRGLARQLGRPPAFWDVHLVPGVQYCVLYGEAEDEPAKEYFQRQIFDPFRQHMIVVPNCGHNLATYLNEQKLLTQIVECCRQPDTMARQVQAIVAMIEPAPEALRERAEQLARQRAHNIGRARGVGSPLIAVQPPAQRGAAAKPAPLHQRFAAANLTGDGRLTIEQARSTLPYVARNFDGIDAARKGYVTLEDIRAFLRRVQGGS